MTPSRPYILRALYEWIVDNECTPHVVALVDGADVQVPMQYVNDGQIVLNIAPGAVAGLLIGNESLAFSARFGGRPFQVSLPMRSVLGIYARENGQGMMFEAQAVDANAGSADPDDNPPPPSPDNGSGAKPSLRVVK
jgi:stringent starvation protein B